MFTGIIEALGKVVSIRPFKQGFDLTVDTGMDLSNDKIGDSFAVDGVCLTATVLEGSRFTALASAETVSRSTLGSLRPGSRVNIERAVALGGRMGGHLVLGHVDCMGNVVDKGSAGESTRMSFRFDKKFSRYIIEKGSIAIDGVSLTINGFTADTFDVNIIPLTAESVSLTLKTPGDRVNLEFDVIGKYVERLLKREDDSTLEALLKKQGFI